MTVAYYYMLFAEYTLAHTRSVAGTFCPPNVLALGLPSAVREDPRSATRDNIWEAILFL